MNNESECKPAITLHVYHPPYAETKVMKPETGEVFMGKIAYYSKEKEVVPGEGDGIAKGGV